MRFTEFFQTVPSFALAIVLVAILQPSIVSIVAAIAIVSWPPVARRGCARRGAVARTREYVQAAIVTGQSNSWIIWREILPNALSPVIVLASLMVATAILLESSLPPRPRRSQSDVVGLHGRRRPHRDPPGLVDHGVSRHRHSDLGAWR